MKVRVIWAIKINWLDFFLLFRTSFPGLPRHHHQTCCKWSPRLSVMWNRSPCSRALALLKDRRHSFCPLLLYFVWHSLLVWSSEDTTLPLANGKRRRGGGEASGDDAFSWTSPSDRSKLPSESCDPMVILLVTDTLPWCVQGRCPAPPRTVSTVSRTGQRRDLVQQQNRSAADKSPCQSCAALKQAPRRVWAVDSYFMH